MAAYWQKRKLFGIRQNYYYLALLASHSCTIGNVITTTQSFFPFLNRFTWLLVLSNSSCASFFGAVVLLGLVFLLIAVGLVGLDTGVVDVTVTQSLDFSCTIRSLV